MLIAPMTVSDLDEVLSLEAASFKNPWGRLAFIAELACNHAYDYVLRADRQGLIAYACFRLVSGELHVLKIAVKKPYRNRGIAEDFFRQCIARMPRPVEKAFLEVRPSNIAAIRLYTRLGFSGLGMRPGYYLDTGEDAIMMGKLFEGGTNECEDSD
jgi:ribosomal-protein-alanine N-acetyltransferase